MDSSIEYLGYQPKTPPAECESPQPTMPTHDPIIYFNGTYVPKSRAVMSVDDRGTLYGDGVYEVLRCYAGRPLGIQEHLDRLRESLGELSLTAPLELDGLTEIVDQLLQRNSLSDAKVYFQITRGAAPRNPMFPADISPTVLAVASREKPLELGGPVPTLTAMLAEDERWSNCWIKSLMLLPNILASNAAQQAGYDAAILHRSGRVTEATNANIMAVRAGELWTHPADRWILNGVTRRLVLDLAGTLGLTVREETFNTDQLLAAAEVLMTGTTLHVTAVTHVGGRPIADGRPGPITHRLHEAINQHIHDRCLSV
jgi:D-alanine transaminase